MEEAFKFLKKWKTTFNICKMEDDLKYLENGRQPNYLENGRLPQSLVNERSSQYFGKHILANERLPQFIF